MIRNSPRIVVPKMAEVCRECGCSCNSCFNDDSLDLHSEIEQLRSQLKKSSTHISQMERDFVQSRDYAEQEIYKLQDELAKLRDRYDRLFDSHKKLQRVNHNLEDKLLKIVNKFDEEKCNLQKEIAAITSKLVDSKSTICELEEENERYRNDCNLAVQLLQCKPSNFVAHKLNTLPLDLQERVKVHMSREQVIQLEDAALQQTETRMIRVPMPTFPPTAMVYSVNKQPSEQNNKHNPTDTVPMTLIAKVLTPAAPRRKPRRIYVCVRCNADFSVQDQETQTVSEGVYNGYSHARTHPSHPGVHRPRLSSTETEIN